MIKNYLWTLPFLLFISGYIGIQVALHQPQITTPSLVGNSIHYAITVLSHNNLNIRILSEKEDADLPPGTVLSQTPAAGQLIKPHQSVFVLLSKQPPTHTVPNLLHQSIDDIKTLTKKSGINCRYYVLPSTYPLDTCFAQYPIAGQSLEHESLVAYIAAPLQKPIIWPDFYGCTVSEVQSFLSSYQVSIQVLHQYTLKNHTCSECVVINQRPQAGSLIMLDPEKPLHVQLQV
ncbi:MAG TPA: PASTA domain-containing protein [Candidatus Dependentiae bacterium]|nr:PASTA domain-containing protein [Candidatus Dependentiae bacterium]HRQ62750.1 PASTA domain-containing protein [Candidatus Dependentiae bacterium]